MMHIDINLESAAYHEAGHVAMIYYHGRDIDHASIEPTWNTAGHVARYCSVPSGNPPLNINKELWANHKKDWLEWSIMELIAGAVAELRRDCKPYMTDSYLDVSSHDDMKQIKEWCELLEVSISDERVDKLVQSTVDIFSGDSKIWKFVNKLVKQLLKKTTLSHKQCKKIWNSTVDEENKLE